jgi:hypothetical protein
MGPYRTPEIPEMIPAPEESTVVPWYKQWFINPWLNMKCLSTNDPYCVVDGWGRRWYQRSGNYWVSISYPNVITYSKKPNIFNRLVAVMLAQRAIDGEKIYTKD